MPLVFFDRILEGYDVNAVVLDDRAGGYQRHPALAGAGLPAHRPLQRPAAP
ncbi:MAG: hypothetical protein WKG07_38035 [Hymenobacter sp.]